MLPLCKRRLPELGAQMVTRHDLSENTSAKGELASFLSGALGSFVGMSLIFLPFAVSATSDTVPKADRGQTVFQTRCSQCHAGPIPYAYCVH